MPKKRRAHGKKGVNRFKNSLNFCPFATLFRIHRLAFYKAF
jgi:hypothetical protein